MCQTKILEIPKKKANSLADFHCSWTVRKEMVFWFVPKAYIRGVIPLGVSVLERIRVDVFKILFSKRLRGLTLSRQFDTKASGMRAGIIGSLSNIVVEDYWTKKNENC